MSESEEPVAESTAFPEARQVPIPATTVWSSRVWWVTLLAVALAGYLVWQSINESGPQIMIRFREGHGLKVGDFVRHRGIDVGHVERIELSEDLQSIEVEVALLRGAEGLAREGTQFWIVRPQVSLTEVRGLETALGAKYIAVRPSTTMGNRHYDFQGLATPPIGDQDRRGLEIILRGRDSFGLYPGAPITWRGVAVGEVLSVNLAADTRYVDIRTRIDAPYRRLVKNQSRFWSTSGLGIDASLTGGFTLKAQSLATIARGGVSFITPQAKDSVDAVHGQVFTLHEEEDKSWVESAAQVHLVDFPLPPTVQVLSRWRASLLGFSRSREQRLEGVLLRQSDKVLLVAPQKALQPSSQAIENSWKCFLLGSNDQERELPVVSEASGPTESLWQTMVLPAAWTADWQSQSLPADRIRELTEPEDCLLVRSVTGNTDGPSSVVQSIARDQLVRTEDGWSLESSGISTTDWEGALVVSVVDGQVVGMLIETPLGPQIVPLSPLVR